MCGIVGLISKHGTLSYQHKELFTNLLVFDSIRGPDSTGIFGVSKDGKIDSCKGNANGYVFTQSKQYSNFVDRIPSTYYAIIGHNRKATRGKISPENAHPFRERHIILVHNGTIRNSGSLNKEVEVDSHAIAHALADHDASEALSKLDGAYSLVWFDQEKKTLNLARNHERPLVLLEYPSFWIISSEHGLPIWLMGREGKKHDSIVQVPTEKILIFPLNLLSEKPKEIPYEEYSNYTPLSYKEWPRGPQEPVISPPVSLKNNNTLMEKIVTQLIKKKTGQEPKTGDNLIFRVDDYDDSDPTHDTLLGHPLFPSEGGGHYIDTNIVVRAIRPKDGKLIDYIDGTKFCSGIVAHIRPMGGMPVIFVKQLAFAPTVLKTPSASNDETSPVVDLSGINVAMNDGCPRCKKPFNMKPEELVEKGLVMKRKNGGFRLLCPECLRISCETANQNLLNAKGLSLVH